MAVTSSTKERRWNEKLVKIKSYYSTENGAAPAIAYSVVPKSDFKLVGIRVGASGGALASENFTVSIDNGVNANLDGAILTVDLSTQTLPYEWLFDPLREYNAGDEVDIAYANTNSRSVTIELIVREQY